MWLPVKFQLLGRYSKGIVERCFLVSLAVLHQRHILALCICLSIPPTLLVLLLLLLRLSSYPRVCDLSR